MATFLTLGRVLKPHGVGGQLKCACYSEDLDDFLNLEQLWLAHGEAKPTPFVVRKAREQASLDGVVLVHLEGLTNRDMAEAWREADILVKPEDLPEAEEDEVYIEDLLGAEMSLENGAALGVFDHILESGAEYDIWVIRTPEKGEILFPALPEFLKEIDAEAMRIVIDPPVGLVELYQEEASAGASRKKPPRQPGRKQGRNAR